MRTEPDLTANPDALDGAPAPWRGHFRINGTTIYAEMRGDGSPVLLIPGGAEDAEGWRAVAERLAGPTVVTYDRRGTLRSGREDWPGRGSAQHADDAAGLLREIGMGPAVVFGGSLAGIVATQLALRYPTLIGRALIFEPGYLRCVRGGIELQTAAHEAVVAHLDRHAADWVGAYAASVTAAAQSAAPGQPGFLTPPAGKDWFSRREEGNAEAFVRDDIPLLTFDAVQDAIRFDVSGSVAVVAVVLGLALLPVAAFGSRLIMALHRAIVEELLCVSPNQALRQDVERLRQTRSAAVELEASELRRIERDLHDGAQQRLVRLAMDLGMAEDRLESDPAAARILIVQAREQTRLALAELRDLVRGVAPAILVDRGLAAAVGSLAARCPVLTFLDSRSLGGQRLPPAVERAAYFVVAEALANVAKHSRATRCDVVLYRHQAGLVVDIRDNGRGGAVVRPGGGLAGLRDRAAALDGQLALWSPPGGPTVLRVDLPLPPG